MDREAREQQIIIKGDLLSVRLDINYDRGDIRVTLCEKSKSINRHGYTRVIPWPRDSHPSDLDFIQFAIKTLIQRGIYEELEMLLRRAVPAAITDKGE